MDKCNKYNKYKLGQQVSIPDGDGLRGEIAAVKPEGESVMYLIGNEWYSEQAIWDEAQAIIEAYYARNAWAKPGSMYKNRSFVTGHYR